MNRGLTMLCRKSCLHLVLAVAMMGVLDARGEPGIDVRGYRDRHINPGDDTPSFLDGTHFGTNIISGIAASNTFTVTNAGSSVLYLTDPSVIAFTGDIGDFSVNTNGVVTNVAAGAITTFRIVFAPESVGIRTGKVSIANNAAGMNPYDFMVQGVGTTPEIAVIGTNGASITNGITLPSFAAGTAYPMLYTNILSATNTFVITNSGSAVLRLTAPGIVAVTGDADDFSVNTNATLTSIAPGSFTTFKIVFDPTLSGTRTGIVSIANSDTDEDPFTFAVAGTGSDVPEPEIAVHGAGHSLILSGDVEPSIYDGTDFGIANIGDVAVTNVFSITNNGLAHLYLTDAQIVLITGDIGVFTAVNNGMTTNIAPGGATKFAIVFDPTSGGTKTGLVSIANSDSSRDPYVFSIQARVRPRLRVISGNFAGGWAKQLVSAPDRVDGVVPVNNWNFFDCGNNNRDLGVPHTISALVDSVGEATTAIGTIFDNRASSWGDSLTGPADSILGSGEVDDAWGPSILTLTKIPFARYDVYAYAGNMPDTVDHWIELISPSSILIHFTNTPAESIRGDFNDGTADGGGNYVRFTNLVSSSFQVTFMASPGRNGIVSGFQIVELPPVTSIDNANGATNVTAGSAFLNGTLVMTDAVPTEVWVYWGKIDCGTNAAAWAYTNFFGTNTGTCPVPYTTNVTLPTGNTVYYYRYCQRNAYLAYWAPTTTNFINAAVSLVGVDTSAAEAWLNAAKFRVYRSGATTNQAVQANYNLAGTASNGVDYVPLPGFVIIPAGETNADVTITPIDDYIPFQTNHSISITLADGGYIIGTESNTVVTIAENDLDASYHPASIGITFGDGTQGPPLGSQSGPGVPQDYWNNVDVRPWRTFNKHYNNAGIDRETGFGPYETDVPTIIATKDSHNGPVSIGFVVSNTVIRNGPGDIVPRDGAGFTGTSHSGPGVTNYDKTMLSYAPGHPDGGTNWIRISGIPYNNYSVYIWATNLCLGLTNTDVYFNCATNFVNQTGDLYFEGAGGDGVYRSISYIQIVENPVPPYINNEPGPVERSDGVAAWLMGTLLATNGSPAEVWMYWGLTDGGTNVAGWGNTNYIGINTGACPVTNSVKVALPFPNTTYYYRYCASNTVGLGWADPVASFKNQGGTVIIAK